MLFIVLSVHRGHGEIAQGNTDLAVSPWLQLSFFRSSLGLILLFVLT